MASGIATMAARTTLPTSTWPTNMRLRVFNGGIGRWNFSPRVFSAVTGNPAASSSSTASRKLILYSKPGCCLCDGLKEKLDAAFCLSGPDSIHDVELEIRDITSNPEWENAYQYEIPVLARVRSDGTEETLARLSPRLRVELIQKKIAAALSH